MLQRAPGRDSDNPAAANAAATGLPSGKPALISPDVPACADVWVAGAATTTTASGGQPIRLKSDDGYQKAYDDCTG